MKVISLCGGSCKCPVIELDDNEVRIGETGNLCKLKKSEWEALVEKIRSGEID